jgi:threonine aldolase
MENAIRPDIYYFPKTSLIALENTHNRHGGTILSLDYIREVRSFAEKNNLKMHLDGARLWNAIVATDIPADKWAENFDTVTVCFSKGLGAPAGSILVGSKENIKKARKWRKILGGGMRQTGILAAAAFYALQNNISKIADDNKNARLFVKTITANENINLDISRVQTNIVYFDYSMNDTADSFIRKCRDNGLLMINTGQNTVRAVFHLHISREQAKEAAAIVLNCL